MNFGLLGGATPKPTSGGGGGSTVITSDDVMSEIKEIKYTIWLDEYKSFGEESHVFNNKDNWAELMQSNAALNDSTMSATAFNFLVENDIDPLVAMGNVYGTGINFKQYSSFEDIVSVGDNVIKIINHPVLSKMVYGYAPYSTSLYGSDSSIWDIMDLDLANKVATNPAFLSYADGLPTLTTQESVSEGYYFLVKINIAGRSWYNDTDNQSYTHDNFRGCSGASYKNYVGDNVVVQNAIVVTQSSSYDDKTGSVSGLGDRLIGKFAKSISLTVGSSLSMHTSVGGGQYYCDNVTFKSTAYYKVIRP